MSELELHESSSVIRNQNKYRFKFEGFYLLCSNCHQKIHKLRINRYSLFYLSQIISDWENEGFNEYKNLSFLNQQFDFFKTYGDFENEISFFYELSQNLKNAFYFSLCNRVYIDYKVAEKYVGTFKIIKANFLYNPSQVKLSFLLFEFTQIIYELFYLGKSKSEINISGASRFNIIRNNLIDQIIEYEGFFRSIMKYIELSEGQQTLINRNPIKGILDKEIISFLRKCG